jgi:O-antigen ligase
LSLLVGALVLWLLVRVRWDLSRAEAMLASGALGLWWGGYLVIIGDQVDLQPLVVLLVLVAAAHALVGLGQFALQSDMGLQILGEEQLDPIRGGITVIEIDGQRILRAYGLARHPNTVGGLLALGALAAASDVWLSRSQRQRWLSVIALGLITAGLVVTFSRSAWLGALGGGLVWVWAARLHRPRPWFTPRVVAVSLASLVVVAFVVTQPELFAARLLGGLSQQFRLEQGSLVARAESLQTAWAVIQQAPFVGVGVRGYLPAAALAEGSVELAHNVPLLLWAEAGIGALALWLGLWGVMLWAARRGNPGQPGLSVALAWMTCLQVANQFNYYAAPAQNLQAPVMLGLICGAWAVSFASPALTGRPGGPEDTAD